MVLVRKRLTKVDVKSVTLVAKSQSFLIDVLIRRLDSHIVDGCFHLSWLELTEDDTEHSLLLLYLLNRGRRDDHFDLCARSFVIHHRMEMCFLNYFLAVPKLRGVLVDDFVVCEECVLKDFFVILSFFNRLLCIGVAWPFRFRGFLHLFGVGRCLLLQYRLRGITR